MEKLHIDLQDGEFHQEDRIILYCDILGFKDFLEHDEAKIRPLIEYALDPQKIIKKFFEVTNRSSFSYMENKRYVTIKVMDFETYEEFFSQHSDFMKINKLKIIVPTVNILSDTMIITIPYNINYLSIIFEISIILHLTLLQKFKLNIRGSISVGNVIFFKNTITGLGLNNADNLEKKIAKFPRIVLDPKLEEYVGLMITRGFALKDEDGKFFVNYLGFMYTDYYNLIQIYSLFDKEKIVENFKTNIKDLRSKYDQCFEDLKNISTLSSKNERDEIDKRALKYNEKLQWLENYLIKSTEIL